MESVEGIRGLITKEKLVGFPGIGKDLPGIGKDLPGIGKEGWLGKDGDCLLSKRDVVARLNNGQGPMHCWELAGMSS